MALANVGLFYVLRQPPLVPDMMLALDVPGVGPDLRQKPNRSYFIWVQGGSGFGRGGCRPSRGNAVKWPPP